MPPELMAKFFDGVEDARPELDDEWNEQVQLRPSRLGLGAGPRAKKKTTLTHAEQRIVNRTKVQDSDSSDSGERDFRRSKK